MSDKLMTPDEFNGLNQKADADADALVMCECCGEYCTPVHIDGKYMNAIMCEDCLRAALDVLRPPNVHDVEYRRMIK